MDISDDKKLAAEKILKFVDKYLEGDIDKITTFPLSKLLHDKEFGCPSNRSFDCDDTELMRCIYVLIFSDVWPCLSFETLGNYTYRGDTMNTYNTLFGKPNYHNGIWHPGLNKFHPSDSLKKKVVDFHLKGYNLIGNMVVLPNIEFEGKTINRYRGCNHTHDFFDRFLYDLKSALIKAPDCDITLHNLVKANALYLYPFLNQSGFKVLSSKLFFEDYLDSDLNPVVSSKAFYYWIKDVTSEAYLGEADRYIDFANKTIEHRGRHMLKILKDQLCIFK